ncbi:hypothetical protein [Microvirga sp. Mcv34]|uniref:hypothetical protein n=1 Tax=Microvirga sp. Mcv34 TaxID=2926016 RepID=UPI0021C738C5|nr:hypothetical protein [Microvirga sp. Mcv34]
MDPNATFAAACRSGDAAPSEIDRWVERWHTGSSDLELHEFLGLSIEEYIRWVKEPASIDEIIWPKRA